MGANIAEYTVVGWPSYSSIPPKDIPRSVPIPPDYWRLLNIDMMFIPPNAPKGFWGACCCCWLLGTDWGLCDCWGLLWGWLCWGYGWGAWGCGWEFWLPWGCTFPPNKLAKLNPVPGLIKLFSRPIILGCCGAELFWAWFNALGSTYSLMMRVAVTFGPSTLTWLTTLGCLCSWLGEGWLWVWLCGWLWLWWWWLWPWLWCTCWVCWLWFDRRLMSSIATELAWFIFSSIYATYGRWVTRPYCSIWIPLFSCGIKRSMLFWRFLR